MNEEKETPKQEQPCDHTYQFFGVGQGKYDNYRCTKCGHEISKRWENEYNYR